VDHHDRPPAPAHVPEDAVPSAEPDDAPSGLRSRAVWTIADQALSSLTNSALSILVARAVGAADFGAFSVALLIFMFVIGLVRSGVTDPLIIQFSGADSRSAHRAARDAAGVALLIGVVTACGCVAVAAVTGGVLAAALVGLALSLPGLMVQDTWRSAFFSRGRPDQATLLDLVWAIVQFAVVGMLMMQDRESVFTLVLAWGAAATASALVGCRLLGDWPDPAAAWSWLRENGRLSWRLSAGYVVNTGAVNLAYALIGAVAGLTALGALRAAQVLLVGPIQLLSMAASSFFLPVMSVHQSQGRVLNRISTMASAALVVVSLGWTLVLLLLPDAWGRELLGSSWVGASAVLVAAGVGQIATAVSLGPSLALKTNAAGALLRVIAVQSPLLVAFGGLGAAMGGAEGAAYGLAIAQAIGAVLCWIVLVRVPRGAPADHALSEV
jgi:O-antigen/teichoic acid export membrane protein